MRTALVAAMVAMGCVSPVLVDGDQSCPCSDGYQCCATTNTCLARTAVCPASDGGVTGETPVQRCELFATLAQADVFFKNRCASSAGCHTKENAHRWQDYETPNVWERMRGASGIMSCAGIDKVIELGDDKWRKSMLLVKTTYGSPVCSNQAPAGEQMPPQSANDAGMYPPLDNKERTCIENYVSAASRR